MRSLDSYIDEIKSRVYYEPEEEPPEFVLPPCPKNCKHPNNGRHWHGDAFKDYKDGLTEPQLNWLRNRSTKHQQSLSASARSARGGSR